VDEIMAYYPGLEFIPSSRFVWSPGRRTVYYPAPDFGRESNQLGLLHEIGHAELGHTSYHSDIHLLGMEVDAWSYARQKAPEFGLTVDEAHIHACLESYRIWVHKRSVCPRCQFHGVQTTPIRFDCFMCRQRWRVSRGLSLQPRRMDCRSLASRD
jgi:hypothetical protein